MGLRAYTHWGVRVPLKGLVEIGAYGSFPKLLFPKWGKYIYWAPYHNRNLNIGPRIDSNLGQSPYRVQGRSGCN